MKTGRVIGRLVCNTLYEGLEGVPMLWVQPLDKTGSPKGKALVAADQTRCAGEGDVLPTITVEDSFDEPIALLDISIREILFDLEVSK